MAYLLLYVLRHGHGPEADTVRDAGVPGKGGAVKKFTFALALVLALAYASPALAATGAEFGRHHADHAIEMNGFTGDMNPGVKHTGFAGWEGHEG